jgi:hypothetical protein
MSFIDNAIDLLNRTEASLNLLIADAVNAKAYRDVAQIASLAESLAAITRGRSATKRNAELRVLPDVPSMEPTKPPEPSWIRPKT